MNVITCNLQSPHGSFPTRASTADPAPIVFVVDDDPSMREAVETLLEPAGYVVRTFACADALLDTSPATGPSCLVLNMGRPGGEDVAVQARIARERTAMPIVVVTGHPDVPMTVEAMKTGALEVLVKPLRKEVFLDVLERAIESSRATVAAVGHLRRLRLRYDTLSPREKAVMDLVVSGLLNKQIAFELRISEATVKTHRGRVMEKMQARSLADLVRMSGSLELP